MKSSLEIPGWFAFEKIYEWMFLKAKDGAQFVEVGAFLGKSTVYMASRIKRSTKNITFHVVDTWLGDPACEHQMSAVAGCGGDLYDSRCNHPLSNAINRSVEIV